MKIAGVAPAGDGSIGAVPGCTKFGGSGLTRIAASGTCAVCGIRALAEFDDGTDGEEFPPAFLAVEFETAGGVSALAAILAAVAAGENVGLPDALLSPSHCRKPVSTTLFSSEPLSWDACSGDPLPTASFSFFCELCAAASADANPLKLCCAGCVPVAARGSGDDALEVVGKIAITASASANLWGARPHSCIRIATLQRVAFAEAANTKRL